MRFAAAIAVALCLGGCANLQYAYDKATSIQVTPRSVIIAGNAFDALEATATNYLRLGKCTGSNGPACRDPAASKRIISAIRQGRAARADIEQFVQDHPTSLIPQTLSDKLNLAIHTIQSILGDKS